MQMIPLYPRFSKVNISDLYELFLITNVTYLSNQKTYI